MKRPRSGRCTQRECYHDDLLKATGRYLPRRGLPLIAEDRRVRWTDRILVTVAILMGWSAASSQQDALVEARDATVEMYPSRRRPGATLTGFLSALVRGSRRLLRIVVPALRQATERVAGRYWRLGKWVLMGVDGSRVECPRTAANQKAFGRGGKEKTTPQQWLTTVFHAATGLLWDWRRGRADSAERTHLRQMLSGLPERTMLLADAGFTGFDLLRSVLAGGHDFIVRVGSNVQLLTELGWQWEKVNRKGIVYLWPESHRNRPPLVLRLVRIRTAGKSVYLLTSVLQEAVLSDMEIASIYALRWGIEVMYRSLKQTMGKRKMRSDAPAQARAELDWAMVGYWLLGLMTVEHVMRAGHLPGDWSVAGALRTVRQAIRRPHAVARHGGLFGQLSRAVKDGYQRRRPKRARNWPRKKTQRPAGRPRIRMAKASEIRQAQAFQPAEAAE